MSLAIDYRQSIRMRPTPLVSLRHPDITISDALNAGEQIAQRLRSLEDSVAPFSLRSHFYNKIRVKAHESIREKVKRIQQGDAESKPQPLYSFRDLTDIVGFRLVTLYDDELPFAVTHVVDLVRSGQTLTPPLFSEGPSAIASTRRISTSGLRHATIFI
jgi:hypothetical protein